jgi:glycerophosphoryl diester phosphodiesterase
MTLVIAHRGASADAPENTLAAFELAIQQASDMIELDLHRSRDGALPIFHDDAIDGRTVGQLTLAELRARVPAMPTLDEVLDTVGARIPLNLELKAPGRAIYEGLCEQVLEAVRARGALGRMLFSSFGATTLDRLRALCPEARIGVLVGRSRLARAPDARVLIDRARALAAEAAHLPLRLATRSRVARLREAGLDVHVYTVDDPRDQTRLIEHGVSGIFTNRPGELRALLRGRGEPAPGPTATMGSVQAS